MKAGSPVSLLFQSALAQRSSGVSDLPNSLRPVALVGGGRIRYIFVVLLYLLFAAVPTWLDIAANGRQESTIWGMADVQGSVLGALVGRALLVLLVVLSLSSIFSRDAVPLPPMFVAGMALYVGASVLASWTSGFEGSYIPVVVNCLVVLAILRLGPGPRDLVVFGICALGVAIVALAYGVVADGAWMIGTRREGSDSKAIFGDGVLAGPFAHMNMLGMGLVMAIPFVALISRARIRRISFGVIMVCLVLSASRSSMVALAVGLAFVVAVYARSYSVKRFVFVVVLLCVTVASVALPFLVTSPSALTYRGQIWLTVRSMGFPDLNTGLGFGAFSRGSSLSSAIGMVKGAAHNVPMHAFVVGGLVGALGLGLMLFAVARGALSALRWTAGPAMFVVVAIVLGATEMPFRLESMTGQAWAGLPLIASIVGFPFLASSEDQTV